MMEAEPRSENEKGAIEKRNVLAHTQVAPLSQCSQLGAHTRVLHLAVHPHEQRPAALPLPAEKQPCRQSSTDFHSPRLARGLAHSTVTPARILQYMIIC